MTGGLEMPRSEPGTSQLMAHVDSQWIWRIRPPHLKKNSGTTWKYEENIIYNILERFLGIFLEGLLGFFTEPACLASGSGTPAPACRGEIWAAVATYIYILYYVYIYIYIMCIYIYMCVCILCLCIYIYICIHDTYIYI